MVVAEFNTPIKLLGSVNSDYEHNFLMRYNHLVLYP